MKRLFLSIILIIGLLTIGTAYAASGYKAILDYDEYRVGILIYYNDSVSEYITDINDALSEIFPQMSDYNITVVDYGPISAAEVIQIASDVINHGSTAYGWDFCLGVLVDKSTAYNTSTIKGDLFILGLHHEGLFIPFMYVGSFEINEMLQNMKF